MKVKLHGKSSIQTTLICQNNSCCQSPKGNIALTRYQGIMKSEDCFVMKLCHIHYFQVLNHIWCLLPTLVKTWPCLNLSASKKCHRTLTRQIQLGFSLYEIYGRSREQKKKEANNTPAGFWDTVSSPTLRTK